MSDDATLSDFHDAADRDGSSDRADSADSDSTAGRDDANSAATDGRDDRPNDDGENGDGVETTGDGTPSTFAWGEYICTRCDRETERVWRDDGSLVCPDCKTW